MMNCSACAPCIIPDMEWKRSPEETKMLDNINMVSFAIVELTLYLDTHPQDQEALSYFNYYNRMYNRLVMDFAAKYYPVNIMSADVYCKEWKWGAAPMPWEGVC